MRYVVIDNTQTGKNTEVAAFAERDTAIWFVNFSLRGYYVIDRLTGEKVG